MLPCFKLEDLELSFRKKDSLYNQLLSYWSESVGLNIEEQIYNWNNQKNYDGKNATPYKFQK